MQLELSDLLRRYVLGDISISAVARETGIPQATLQEFAVGKSDGSYADLRMSSAQKLIDHYGLGTGSKKRVAFRKGNRMRLIEELKIVECTDSPEKFRERLIDNLVDGFPGMTIDSLVCTPREALSYCGRIREGVGSESLYDAVILKALMNIRKRKDCPTGLRSRGRRLVLKKELAEVACNLSPTEFKELVVDCLAGMYRDQTIDGIVCHPREAMALCNYVRMRSKCDALSDYLVLSTLMNVRKAGGQ